MTEHKSKECNSSTEEGVLAQDVVDISPEQMERLDAVFLEFVDRAESLEQDLEAVRSALKEGQDIDLPAIWPLIQQDLELLSAMAIRLKMGENAETVRQTLHKLLDLTKRVQQALLELDSEHITPHQQAKAAKAYSTH